MSDINHPSFFSSVEIAIINIIFFNYRIGSGPYCIISTFFLSCITVISPMNIINSVSNNLISWCCSRDCSVCIMDSIVYDNIVFAHQLDSIIEGRRQCPDWIKSIVKNVVSKTAVYRICTHCRASTKSCKVNSIWIVCYDSVSWKIAIACITEYHGRRLSPTCLIAKNIAFYSIVENFETCNIVKIHRIWFRLIWKKVIVGESQIVYTLRFNNRPVSNTYLICLQIWYAWAAWAVDEFKTAIF